MARKASALRTGSRSERGRLMGLIAKLTAGCKGDCRVSLEGGVSTLVGWTPVYDRHGQLLNEDPNTHTQGAYCGACRKRWTVSQTAGKTTIVPVAA